jgi:hypothetical protein
MGMSETRQSLLVLEVLVCFTPSLLALLMTAVSLTMMLTASDDGGWGPRFEAAWFLALGGAGLTAAYAMLVYILSGQRIISRRTMIALAVYQSPAQLRSADFDRKHQCCLFYCPSRRSSVGCTCSGWGVPISAPAYRDDLR